MIAITTRSSIRVKPRESWTDRRIQGIGKTSVTGQLNTMSPQYIPHDDIPSEGEVKVSRRSRPVSAVNATVHLPVHECRRLEARGSAHCRSRSLTQPRN